MTLSVTLIKVMSILQANYYVVSLTSFGQQVLYVFLYCFGWRKLSG